MGEPQEESDLADKKLQGQVGAGKAEYRVNSVLQGTSQFQGMIDTSAARHGLDPVMLARQLHQESGLDPNVKDSSAGAQGIAQFMPDTARRFGVNVRSPASSIEGAATYMDWLLQQPYIRGNVGLALAGYNWGEGNVQAWAAGGFNPRQGPPKETRDYVKAITGQTISDWLGGTRPDWTELGYPQTVGNARQQAVALTQQEMTRTDIPVSQRNLNVAAMDKAIKLSDENNIKLANLREQSQKQADDTFLDQVLKNQTSETEKRVTVQDVEQMPGSAQGGPSFAAKERAIKLINQSDTPEVPKAVSDSNTLDYFRRINLPPGDPNRIVNRSTLQDALGDRQFTREAYDWLAKKLEDARTPGGEHLAQLRGQFFTAATAAIDKSNPIRGITDPDAKLRAYAFERMVDAKMDAARAENKDPAVYITPGTAEYLGKPEILAPYQKTMQQQIQDVRARMQRPQQPGSTIPPVVPPARAEPSASPPHNPGESPADYMRRIGAGP